jgi:hypothetical protein
MKKISNEMNARKKVSSKFKEKSIKIIERY